jgi:hypothetical protein
MRVRRQRSGRWIESGEKCKYREHEPWFLAGLMLEKFRNYFYSCSSVSYTPAFIFSCCFF